MSAERVSLDQAQLEVTELLCAVPGGVTPPQITACARLIALLYGQEDFVSRWVLDDLLAKIRSVLNERTLH